MMGQANEFLLKAENLISALSEARGKTERHALIKKVVRLSIVLYELALDGL